MPEPLPLRKVLGPGVIAAGIGLASGEFILWPRSLPSSVRITGFRTATMVWALLAGLAALLGFL